MAKLALLAVAAMAAHAAVIRGVVVEHQTGKPLAHALVVAAPVAGTPGTVQSARTNGSGAFEFLPVPAGAYLVSASRRGFAPAQYGQKRFRGAGVPIILEDAASTFLNIRLQRFGAITGIIVDENDVGLPEHDVIAYRNTRPPVIAGRGRTDDRGVHRIWGLEPGSYLVRTLAKQSDEESYLPTFAPTAERVNEARAYDVALDQQTADANIRPVPGRLISVGGRILPQPFTAVTVTLISDIGTETTVSDNRGEFQFQPVAPGPYELFSQTTLDRRFGGGTLAGYEYIVVDRDRSDYRLNMEPLPQLRVQIEDTKGQPVDTRTIQLIARRKELSGDAPPVNVKLGPGSISLLPGRWELALPWLPGHYAASFSGPRYETSGNGRADGWNEVTLAGGPNLVKFILSPNPASLRGTVTTSGSPVLGAPVFLEAYDLVTQRRLTDLRIARTDMKGQYQFYGLAPGNYRVLSSFEFQSPDAAEMDAANARVIKPEESRETVADLDLYVIH